MTTQQFILAAILMVFVALGVFYFGRTAHVDQQSRCKGCGGPVSKNVKSCPRCGEPT
jgi:rRNA maturation endonuclease Nob1